MGFHEIKKKLNDLMKKNNQKCEEILLFLHGVYKLNSVQISGDF